MRKFKLLPHETRTVRQRLQQTKDLREFRRLQAILLVTEGVGIKKVASIVGVTVQSVYNWLNRYESKRHPSIMEEGNHPGRPPLKSLSVTKILRDLLERKPRECGYSYPTWTARLIAEHLKRKHNLEVSVSTVRRCLRRMRFRGKSYIL